jgi:8-oxo-dGTP pyrophosphatase MutT (NUDIX family)
MLVTPRKAATVSIIKDNLNKMEVLLMLRHRNDRFLPDYHVFPGGAMDAQDRDFELPENVRTGELKHFEGNTEKYYANIICGIRETFEESGLLLAVDSEGRYPSITTKESIKKFGRYRLLVFEKKLAFKEMLAMESLTPAVNNFFYVNRWITPPLFPIRYDTRFFAVKAPDNQETSHDENELVDFEWISPADALQKYRENKMKLVMPTIKTLEFLSRFNSSADAINYFQE